MAAAPFPAPDLFARAGARECGPILAATVPGPLGTGTHGRGRASPTVAGPLAGGDGSGPSASSHRMCDGPTEETLWQWSPLHALASYLAVSGNDLGSVRS